MSELRVNTITNEDGTGSPTFPNGVKDASQLFTTTIAGSNSASDWVQSSNTDPWIATQTVSGILDTDVPIVDIDLSNVAFSDVATVQSDWALVYLVESSANNELKFYAIDEPASDFEVQVKVIR